MYLSKLDTIESYVLEGTLTCGTNKMLATVVH
jgi:hypothetical protein